MRKFISLTMLLGLLAGYGSLVHGAPQTAPQALTLAHFPVFRRELMQSQIDIAYGDLSRKWGAPIQQLVLNSYCDSWRALHARTYTLLAIPGHWLQTARQHDYELLIGTINDNDYTLLLTRAKTDEQLKSLLAQQSVATPDRLASVTSIGRRYLAATLGVDESRIRLTEMPYDDMPVLGMVRGEYQAALTSPNVYERMQSSLKQSLRVIRIPSPPLRGAIVADKRRLNPQQIAQLGNLMLEINRKSRAHGVRYILPDEVGKLDDNQPPVDDSQCPLTP
jgi:hypothetical protein